MVQNLSAKQRRALKIVLTVAVAVVVAIVLWKRYATGVAVRMESVRIATPVVVFESDDWHMRGTESPQIIETLKSKGYTPGFWLKDALETPDDLEKLFAVLRKHKDSTGRPPCFTANFIMTNPDFAKIRESNFQTYSVIPQKDDWDKSLVKLYYKGMKERVFYPQLHGYDHMCSGAWLRQLREGNPEFRLLFDLGVRMDPQTALGKPGRSSAEFVDLSTTPSTAVPYETQLKHLADAQAIFKDVFGFRSLSLIAPCYYFDANTLKAANVVGIKYIQAGNTQCEKVIAKGKYAIHRHYLGQSTGCGDEVYLTRNAHLDPGGPDPYDADACLQQIEWAFNLKLPAVIDTHRIFYMSTNDPKMAEHSRGQLDKLLTQIEKRYPNVRYLTTPELGQLVTTGSYRDIFTGQQVQIPLIAPWKNNTGHLIVAPSLCLSGLILLYVVKRRRRQLLEKTSTTKI
ncbi:MAG: hypothetical protein KAR11_00380 [Phycisphaerae bacterium]|nr:hypothetical protein [Phycisphaerae bacterium]